MSDASNQDATSNARLGSHFIAPADPDPTESSPTAAGWQPINMERSDLAAHIFLVGFVAAVLSKIFLWPASDETFVMAEATTRTGLLSWLLVFVAGLVVIWELPGRAWARAITISGLLILAEPIVTLVWRISNDLSGDLIARTAIYKIVSAQSVMAIVALLTMRNRTRNAGTAHLAIGCLVFAGFFDSFHILSLEAAIGDGSSTVSGLGLLSLVLASFGTMSLVLAVVLAVVLALAGRSSDAMLTMLQHAAIVTAAASIVAYPLARWQLVDDSRNSAESWILANMAVWVSQSLLVAAITIATTMLFRPAGPPSGNGSPVSMGSAVAAAVVFWPLGLPAMSYAATAIASQERGDLGFADDKRRAEQFRNWAFAVGAILFVVSLANSA